MPAMPASRSRSTSTSSATVRSHRRGPSPTPAVLRPCSPAAGLIVTARSAGRCVGLARCLSDFAWVAYCGDLAVHRDFQGRGTGKDLLRCCREELGDGVGIALLSVPEALGFYERSARDVGFRAYPMPFS